MSRINHFTIVTAAALLLTTSIASAQGTATSPSTRHVIDTSTGVVWIGGPNDTINGPAPMPIDLDASGGSWRKGIYAGPGGFGGGPLLLRETIINSGTEPWTDWHEIDAHIGSHGTVWGSVSDVRINGTSITYNATISGATIDLDTFSQPVLPGDIFQIQKTLNALTDNHVQQGTLVASVLEYPTTNVPEPASVVIAAFGLIGCAIARRRRP